MLCQVCFPTMTKTTIIEENENDEKKSNTTNIVQNQLKNYLHLHPNIKGPLDDLLRVTLHVSLDNGIDQLLIIYYLLNEVERISEENKQPSEVVHYNNFTKLHEDISFFSTVLKGTCLELEKKGTYISLIKAILRYAQEEHDKDALENNYKLYKNKVKSLFQQLDNEKLLFLDLLDDYSERITKLKQEADDFWLYGNVKIQYVRVWEDTRQDQHEYIFLKVKEGIENMILETKVKVDMEERIHYEVITYVNENMADLSDQLNYWTEKYDADIEEVDKRNTKMKDLSEAKTKDHAEMLLEYEKRTEELEEYAIVREIRARQLWACIKIQTWWRGLMVRKCMGPFKYLQKILQMINKILNRKRKANKKERFEKKEKKAKTGKRKI